MLCKLALVFSFALTGCASTNAFNASDIEYFQPPIITSVAPERPLNSYSLYNNTIKVDLAPMKDIVPSYNGKGNLLASWNPHPAGMKGRPTFVFVHGGHGLGTLDFASALWARKDLGANTLVLDSYWSRGRQENWQTYNSYGANMRMLDAIAAARWLQEQGVDKDKIFLMGGSQGGWTVMRTFTDEPWIREQTKGLYRGGISVYPVCNSKGYRDDPTLGPYTVPMLVFTGGDDDATPPDRCPSKVFTQSAGWTHYPTATHGFDNANRGAHTPAVDGECGRAANVYNRFKVCRSDSATFDMQDKIKKFVFDLINGKTEYRTTTR
jgi:dienelactone hydrolase